MVNLPADDESNELARTHPGVAERRNKAGSDGVGTALRDAFQATVEEDVPQQLLDLLRRLD